MGLVCESEETKGQAKPEEKGTGRGHANFRRRCRLPIDAPERHIFGLKMAVLPGRSLFDGTDADRYERMEWEASIHTENRTLGSKIATMPGSQP